MMSSGNQVANETNLLNDVANTPTPETDNTGNHQALVKVAIGALVGATLGGLAGALTNKKVVDRINQTVTNAGNSLKKTTSKVNDTVQDVGDAVFTITTNVTDTVKDLGETVKQTAESVNSTVNDTVKTVRSTAIDVNDTVKTTLDSVKDSTEKNLATEEANGSTTPQDTLYKLIPVEPQEQDH